MAFPWPVEFTPRLVSWGIQKASVGFRSPFAGTLDSVEFPGAFWKMSVTLPDLTLDEGTAAQAFFSRLAGGMERVLVPYWPRMQPLGTMRGSPVLAANAVRGDVTLSITGAGTLLRGDMVGVSNYLFHVFTDCAASGGVITVPLVNRVRKPIAAGTPVIWDAPTLVCLVPAQAQLSNFEPGLGSPLAVEMEEA